MHFFFSSFFFFLYLLSLLSLFLLFCVTVSAYVFVKLYTYRSPGCLILLPPFVSPKPPASQLPPPFQPAKNDNSQPAKRAQPQGGGPTVRNRPMTARERGAAATVGAEARPAIGSFETERGAELREGLASFSPLFSLLSEPSRDQQRAGGCVSDPLRLWMALRGRARYVEPIPDWDSGAHP